MGEEDDPSEHAVEDGEDEVHAEVLLVLGDGAHGEGGEGEADAQEQRAQHVARRAALAVVGACMEKGKDTHEVWLIGEPAAFFC